MHVLTPALVCHHHPITVYLASSLINHSTGNFITPTDTTCGHFITPTDTTCGPTLAKSRFCLVYYIYILYIRADYNDASSGFGLWAKTLRGQKCRQLKVILGCRWLLLKSMVLQLTPLTGPKKNSKFCFPRISMNHEAEPRETK